MKGQSTNKRGRIRKLMLSKEKNNKKAANAPFANMNKRKSV
jgi:hypothetical protein